MLKKNYKSLAELEQVKQIRPLGGIGGFELRRRLGFYEKGSKEYKKIINELSSRELFNSSVQVKMTT